MKTRSWIAIVTLIVLFAAAITIVLVSRSGGLFSLDFASSGGIAARRPTSTPVTEDTESCASYDQSFEDQVVSLINQERARQGLPALVLNSALAAAARAHSADMACNNYLSHYGLDGSSPSQRAERQGYTSTYVGENIAAGSSTPDAAVQIWLNSAPHLANLLNSTYTEIGVGYAYNAGSTYSHYWTAVFGRP